VNILVINCGSSSLKYQLIDSNSYRTIVSGLVERIGLPDTMLTIHSSQREKKVITTDVSNHTEAIQLVLNTLVNLDYGVIKSMDEIHVIGHRILHGGAKFTHAVIITNEVMKAVEECIEFGPLHNPANLAGIKACQNCMPHVTQVGVFDTAFHQTMPAKAYIYALPYEVYEKYGIRRYGFHGTSHKYISLRAADLMGKPIEKLKLITCHLGNGASITAVQNGKSVDTSMGLTPLEGLVMGTRCGDIDPDIITILMEKKNLTPKEMKYYLNNMSGVLGISGVSSDFRDLEKAEVEGDYQAKLALDVFAHNVIKYIGAYAAVMDGVDGIVFTAGVGENSPSMRSAICTNLKYLGVRIDEDKNKARGIEVDISVPQARCRVMVIPTNEELMIAMETMAIIGPENSRYEQQSD